MGRIGHWRERFECVRVCLVYDCLFPHTVGGGERWYRNLAERLRGGRARCDLPDPAAVAAWRGSTGVPGVRVVTAGPRMGAVHAGRGGGEWGRRWSSGRGVLRVPGAARAALRRRPHLLVPLLLPARGRFPAATVRLPARGRLARAVGRARTGATTSDAPAAAGRVAGPAGLRAHPPAGVLPVGPCTRPGCAREGLRGPVTVLSGIYQGRDSEAQVEPYVDSGASVVAVTCKRWPAIAPPPSHRLFRACGRRCSATARSGAASSRCRGARGVGGGLGPGSSTRGRVEAALRGALCLVCRRGARARPRCRRGSPRAPQRSGHRSRQRRHRADRAGVNGFVAPSAAARGPRGGNRARARGGAGAARLDGGVVRGERAAALARRVARAGGGGVSRVKLVSAIVVTHRGGPLLDACLPALRAALVGSTRELIVVDNSTAGLARPRARVCSTQGPTSASPGGSRRAGGGPAVDPARQRRRRARAGPARVLLAAAGGANGVGSACGQVRFPARRDTINPPASGSTTSGSPTTGDSGEPAAPPATPSRRSSGRAAGLPSIAGRCSTRSAARLSVLRAPRGCRPRVARAHGRLALPLGAGARRLPPRQDEWGRRVDVQALPRRPQPDPDAGQEREPAPARSRGPAIGAYELAYVG